MTTALAAAFLKATSTEDEDAVLMRRRARPIYGAPFTFRTFPDRHFGSNAVGVSRDDCRTMDQLVTVTLAWIRLPPIDGGMGAAAPTIKIEL